jgi:hypothetical protein
MYITNAYICVPLAACFVEVGEGGGEGKKLFIFGRPILAARLGIYY